MKVPAMRIAMGIATIAVAALTVVAPGAAANPPSSGSGSGGPGPGPLEQIPPKPQGGDGEHEPGEPCEFGHYAWEYETHYGWGWQLVCAED